MKKIAELIGQKLHWQQPSMLHMEYELHTPENEVIATLKFKSTFGSFATAECADGCWTFKRVGFWHTRATIRPCDAEEDIATFRHNTWAGGGTLEFPDGRKLLASTNFWQTRLDIKTETGQPLIRLHTDGFLKMSATVEICPEAKEVVELPWLVMLSFYLAVMMYMDASAASASA